MSLFSGKTDNFDFFYPNLSENIAQNVDSSLEESAPPSSLIDQFSVKIDNFEFFGLNLGKFPIRTILKFE